MINCTVKILTKKWANRVSQFSEKLIDNYRFGFVRGREASESIMVVSEVYHSIKEQRIKRLVLKLDFEKAFDTVN